MYKMNYRRCVIAVFSLVFLFTLSSLSFSANQNEKYLDYPIEYSQLAGKFNGKVTPKLLLSNLFYKKADNGIIIACKLDKQKIEQDRVNYYFSFRAGKKLIATYQITLKISDDDQCNYMTYLRLKAVESGEVQEFKYDPDDNSSYGRVVGAFCGVAEGMFDLEKINKELDSSQKPN